MPFFKKNQKIFALFLVLAISVSFFAIPQQAQALVPDIPADLPASFGDWVSDTIDAMVDTITSFDETWQWMKTAILDPLAKYILHIIIQEMKRMAISYIINGEFGKPRFVQNFAVDLKQAASGAARSFLSQLTGINMCNFLPQVPQSTFSLNFAFRFQCTTNATALYNRFMNDPASLTSLEKMLAMAPSTDFLQTVAAVGQQTVEAQAQALVARAAETSSGFIGDALNLIDPADQTAYDNQVQAEIAQCITDTADNQVQQGLIPDMAAIGQQCQSAGNSVPQPQPSKKIKTPGQTVSALVHKATGAPFDQAIIYDEFDQAIIQIMDVAFGQLMNKGLSELGL